MKKNEEVMQCASDDVCSSMLELLLLILVIRHLPKLTFFYEMTKALFISLYLTLHQNYF